MGLSGFYGRIGTLTPLINEYNLPVYNKCLWYRIPLFDYRYDSPHELIFKDKNGTEYEIDHHFQTDGGSIPPFVRMTPGIHLDPFNFPRAYLYHDCAYQYGGLYIKYYNEVVFKFRLMTRQQADDLLSTLLPFDGATKKDINVINFGIWVGSRFVWNKKKEITQKEARKKDRITVYDKAGNVVEGTAIIK